MKAYEHGEWIRSTQEAWAASAPIPYDLAFLRRSLGMKFPTIRRMYVRVAGNQTMAAGTLSGENAYRYLANFYLADAAGERVNLDVGHMRVAEQIEYGSGGRSDPAALGTSAAQEVWYKVPLFPHQSRCKRAADFNLPVSEFIDFGTLRITCNSATGNGVTDLTINSGTVEVWCHVIDERKAELKSRYVLKQYNWTLAESYFPIDGSLRLLVGSRLTAAGGYGTWSATTQIDSKDLGYMQVPPNLLTREYFENTLAANDTTDEVQAVTALAVFSPKWSQKTPMLPDLHTCHVLLNAAPVAGSVVIVGVVKDRDAEVSARTLGFTDRRQMQTALSKAGKIKTASGQGTRSVANWKANLRKKLPVKVG